MEKKNKADHFFISVEDKEPPEVTREETDPALVMWEQLKKMPLFPPLFLVRFSLSEREEE